MALGETRTWFGRVPATARKGWTHCLQMGQQVDVKQSKLKGLNEPYLDPLSPLAPASPSSAFFASAVSGARRMGFEDAPSFIASLTMTL